MMKGIFRGLMILGYMGGVAEGMFLVPQNLNDNFQIALRHISDEEEENCLQAYDRGMASDSDIDDLSFAIIGHDDKYKDAVQKGINCAVDGGNVEFKALYDGAVIRDAFATLGYRYEKLGKFKEAFFWLRVAAVGNSNYLQDAQRVQNEYNKQK